MATERKSTRHIRTIGALLDRRRTRSTSGALLELSALANERERLRHESERLERRRVEIETRLAEIGQKELWLRTFIKEADGEPGARPLPVADGPSRLSARQLNY